MSINNRINRSTYILSFITMGLVFVLITELILSFAGLGIYILSSIPLAIATAIYQIVLVVKRLHDIGRSGWAWLYLLLPIVNIVMLILLAFIPGKAYENKYGNPATDTFIFPWNPNN